MIYVKIESSIDELEKATPIKGATQTVVRSEVC